MFKILTLQSGVDDQLQSLQNNWEIEAVVNLGTDSVMNHYLLVQYDTPPSSPLPATSGSLEAKAPPKKASK